MGTFGPNPKSICKKFEKKNCKKVAKKLQKNCKKIAKKLQKSCKMRKRNFLLCKIFAKFLQILNLHTDFRPREESVRLIVLLSNLRMTSGIHVLHVHQNIQHGKRSNKFLIFD